jgi:hypothetical protein
MSYKEIMKMPHYGNDLANKRWGTIIQNVWDKLNELSEAVNALNAEKDIKTCTVGGHSNNCECCSGKEIKWAEKAELPIEHNGMGHTGACQPNCQCDVAKMGKPTLKSDEQIQMDYYDLLNREEKAEGELKRCRYCGQMTREPEGACMANIAEKAERCPRCKGSGLLQLNPGNPNTCPDCSGTGKAERCPICNGVGHTISREPQTCLECNGTGKLSTSGEDKIAEIINQEPLPIEGKKWEWAKKLAHAIKEGMR